MRIRIDGQDLDLDIEEALGYDHEAMTGILGVYGIALAEAAREHDRAFAHRAAWRARKVVAASEEHKAWPEWKVKAAADSDPEWLRLSEAVVSSAYNVMVLEAFRMALAARIGQVISPSRISPAFPMASR